MSAVSKARLLLVDNDSDTIIELRSLCGALGYDVTTIHCTKLSAQAADAYDLIVLSGGYWYDDELQHSDQYRAEIALITNSRRPIIGICLGMQLMHLADKGTIPLLNAPQNGSQTITLTHEGESLLGLPQKLTVHKNHTRGIAEALPDYWTLAVSPQSVEIIKHRQRPLIGVQFHPEVEPLEQGIHWLNTLIRTLDINSE